ncbi:hypothetical protein TRIUR3_03246 [Triticum urartu]|uniref:Uncharacterized protein n=1 Tax=Triticum urartu TaxID=4572 RepID=M8B077_TRIUA|nr:hypothetical protein TRIUR3_03246 [Triticum urartu]
MGTRCQSKETQEVLASLQSAMKETPSERHLLLHQQFTDFQEKTRPGRFGHSLVCFVDSRDLERMLKSANNMLKASNALLGVTILGVPLLLIAGSKDQA